jgi:2-polyprenyl-6-methoxyphenol hydroxylase-like FAD-dependent oxidoreductase
MALSVVAPRVAIVGAGISGLALGAMLSRKLPHAQLTVLERSDGNRDEGYGLDLDEHGQTALVRAGVFDRFWDVSRKRSNTWSTYPMRGDAPLVRKFSRICEAESNRAAIRDLFIRSMESRGVAVQYNQHVADVRAAGADLHGIEILRKGPSSSPSHSSSVPSPLQSLGEFDLVVDSSGLHSPLRHHRVRDDVGKHFSGRTLIHGVVECPEESLPPVLVERLGEGTLHVVGRGYSFVLQRFGAKADDRRAAFFYMPDLRDADGQIQQQEMGIAPSTSRESGILRPGQPDFERAREWLHRDMRGAFDPVYHSIVDALSRVTVRGLYNHGEGTALQGGEAEARLPLVCCGDSLRNIGLGGGGNLALQDALAYADALTRTNYPPHPPPAAAAASVPHGGGAFSFATGRLEPAALAALRRAEAEALKRKQQHFENTNRFRSSLFTRRPGHELVTKFGDLAESAHWRVLLNGAQSLLGLATRYVCCLLLLLSSVWSVHDSV